jgi:acid phosphatase type 7
MRKTSRRTGWLLAVVLLLASAVAWGAQPGFVRTPYLGLSGHPATTVAVSWKTTQPVRAIIHYAAVAQFDESGRFTQTQSVSATSGSKTDVYHAALEDLSPNTAYTYQVDLVTDSGAIVARSLVGRFRTAAPGLDHFTFAVYGDTRSNPTHHDAVVDAMIKIHPRFVVEVGDLVEFGGVSALWDNNYFPAIAPLAKDAPYLTVLGNHEQNSPQYYAGFVLPPGGGEDHKEWWSLDYGVVHLVGLDSNVLTLPNGFARMREQIAWLKADLAAARARGERFIFVFFHHPLYSSDVDYAPGNTGLRALWQPIFVKYGVNVVFCGHSHQYERLIEDGINYIVTGGGGAPLGGFLATPIAGSVKRASELHYMRVTIDGDTATIDMIPVGKVESGKVVPVPQTPFDQLVIHASG